MSGVDNDAVADDASFSRIQNSRRQQVQFGFDSFDHYGMTGVIAALITDYDLGLFCQVIDDFPFSFIAPLGSYDYN